MNRAVGGHLALLRPDVPLCVSSVRALLSSGGGYLALFTAVLRVADGCGDLALLLRVS